MLNSSTTGRVFLSAKEPPDDRQREGTIPQGKNPQVLRTQHNGNLIVSVVADTLVCLFRLLFQFSVPDVDVSEVGAKVVKLCKLVHVLTKAFRGIFEVQKGRRLLFGFRILIMQSLSCLVSLGYFADAVLIIFSFKKLRSLLIKHNGKS